jgi:hypothetical protein
MRAARVWLSFGVLTWAPFVVGQTTLGALLDAGANPVSVAQFKDELVQRLIAGPTPTGGKLEVMYTGDGRLQGTGTQAAYSSSIPPWGTITGDWSPDERGRICTSMRVGVSGAGTSVQLPKRCQYWYKLGMDYYFADSDTDRSAKVLVRIIKQ